MQNYRVGAVEAVAPGTFAGGVCWAFRAVVVGTCIVAEGGLVTAGVGETVAVGSSGVGALVGVVPSAVGDVVWSVGSVVGDLVGSMTSGVGARVRLVGRRCHGPGAIGRSSGRTGSVGQVAVGIIDGDADAAGGDASVGSAARGAVQTDGGGAVVGA